MVEYALILVLISIVVIVILTHAWQDGEQRLLQREPRARELTKLPRELPGARGLAARPSRRRARLPEPAVAVFAAATSTVFR